ncbi:hypothetical protein CR983_04035 [Candidatus Saccharibacteria bacterium]|nr:MAG: hypothetical protein CR983_04035 [Candidatus Saccharibacteria bacterium]
MITIIVAMDRARAIGYKNDLPWGRGLKDDLANFKRATRGGSVIMGRRTFESIGARPLPDRENIVLTRQPTGVPGVLSALSLESAYALARYPIFVIGGEQVYRQALPDADRLIVTHVDAEFPEATIRFPAIDPAEWRELSRTHQDADERNQYAFDTVVYERVRK